jgi:hypothetical protein
MNVPSREQLSLSIRVIFDQLKTVTNYLHGTAQVPIDFPTVSKSPG